MMIKKWMLGLCMVAALACGKDDDDVPANTTATVKYDVSSTHLTSLTVTYRNAAGQNQTATVTGNNWSETITVTKPFQASISADGVKNSATAVMPTLRVSISANGTVLGEQQGTGLAVGGNQVINASVTRSVN